MIDSEESRSRRDDGVSVDELLAHGGFLRELARALARDDEAARELVQETWVQALENPPRHGENVRAWLAAVLRRASSRRWRVSPRVEASADEPAERSEPSDVLASADVRAAVAGELEALSEPLRRVVRLRFFDGLPPREISRSLDLPVNTVNSRLQRALARLRSRLDRRLGAGAWVVALLAAGRSRGAATEPVSPRASRRGSRSRGGGGIGVRSVAPRAAAALLAVGAAAIAVVWRAADAGGGREVTLAAARTTETRTGQPERSADAIGTTFSPEAAVLRATPAPRPRETLAARSGARPFVPIDVRVVDPNGVPVAGARVLAHVDDARRVELGATDDDGRLRAELDERHFDLGMGSVFADRAALEAVHPAWTASAVHYVLRDREALELALGPESVAVRGRVRDNASGAPVAGAEVKLGRSLDFRLEGSTLVGRRTAEARTDGEGNFDLSPALPGSHPVRVVADGYVPAQVHWSGRPGEDLDIALDRGARVEGTVRDGDGLPVAGARVWAGWRYTPTPGEPVTCDGDGRFSLTAVLPGKTCLLAFDPARPHLVDTRDVTLVEGRTETWDPVLSASSALVLALVDDAGEPLADWLVNIATKGCTWREVARTDATGRIVRHAVPPDPLTVYVCGHGTDRVGTQPRLVVEGVTAGPEPVRIVVPATRPSARIAGALDASRLGADLDPRVFLRRAGSAFQTSVGVDPRTGRFEAELLAGTWVVCAAFGGLGTVPLEGVALEEGEVRDLGVLLAPDVSYLDLSWSAGQGERLVIQHLVENTPFTTAELVSPPISPIPIAPGELLLTRYRGGDAMSRRVRVAPGTVCALDLEAP